MRSLYSSCLALLTTSALATANPQGATTRISIDSSGVQANDLSLLPSISADGRYVVFVSLASNLVAGDTNGQSDVFVHDLQTAATIRVSVDSSGGQADLYSNSAATSADGRCVVFVSQATNLVAGDGNSAFDVFVHDRQTAVTERVSVNSTGVEGDASSGPGGQVALSADGRFVAFSSTATNLAPGDTNGTSDVFVRDRTLSKTYRVSLDSSAVQGIRDSYAGSLSANGNLCAFTSASSLVATDSNGANDVYVHDLLAGTTMLASLSTNGAFGDDHSGGPSISADGRYVAFESTATTLVINDSNFNYDIFLRDLLSGETSRLSVSPTGAQALGFNSRSPSISADGRYVSFDSGAFNLITGDTNGARDAFVRDTFLKTTLRVSVSSVGAQANGYSGFAVISGDGQRVAFDSGSTNLVANDSNGCIDIFVHDIACWPPANYCDAGLSTNFCIPTMGASGTASASATSGFTLTCTGLEAQKTGLILYGTSGRLAQPWGPPGGSLMCVAHPVQRTTSSNSGGTPNYCDGSISIDWLAFIATHPNALGQPLTPGAIIDAQCWYRDPPAPKGTNLSNGIEFALCP